MDESVETLEGRAHARWALKNRIRQTKRDLAGLEALLALLPENLPSDVDDALWGLLRGDL